MHFKLLIAFVDDDKTDEVIEAARQAGATGTTVITNASGEGLVKKQTFFGLTLESQRNVLLMVVEEHLSRKILEKISAVGEMDTEASAGIAFQIDVEDVVGVKHQIEKLTERVEDSI